MSRRVVRCCKVSGRYATHTVSPLRDRRTRDDPKLVPKSPEINRTPKVSRTPSAGRLAREACASQVDAPRGGRTVHREEANTREDITTRAGLCESRT